MAGISRALPHSTKKQIETALTELEKESAIESYELHGTLYLPTGGAGASARRALAAEEVLAFPPLLAATLAVLLVLVVVAVFDLYGSPPADGATPQEAQAQGMRDGMGIAAIAVFLGTGFILKSGNRFLRWRILSETAYRAILAVSQRCVLFILCGLGVYYVVAEQTHQQMTEAWVIFITTVAITAGVGYERAFGRLKKEKEAGLPAVEDE